MKTIKRDTAIVGHGGITRIPTSPPAQNKKIVKVVVQYIMVVLFLCGTLLSTSDCAKSVAPFDSSPLKEIGDSVSYGSYVIYKLDEGIYKINDPVIKPGSGEAPNVDMYLVVGEKKALMIDLGNNYIEGSVGKGILPRENAAEELREVVNGLTGNMLLEIAFTHEHGDHTGMTSAFLDRNVTIWRAVGPPVDEDRIKQPKPEDRRSSEPSIFEVMEYTLFTPGEKTFDLGGGRIVETFLVRGHTNNSTVYILKNDLLLFTGGAFANGVGMGFDSVGPLKDFAEDSQKFIDYISANFAPYERYGLRVYVGHSWQNVFNGYYSPNMDKVDMGYLDWQYIQNLASCAKGILEGKWLVEGSGLQYVGYMPHVGFWSKTSGRAIIVYGIGAIIIPLQVAYEAAGLEMPE